MNNNNHLLFKLNFTELHDNQFVTVNDGVMGGRSSSSFMISDNEVVFQGEVLLENNGGFASVRTQWPFDVSHKTDQYEPKGVVLKVKGDGSIYQFRLRTDQGFDGAAYSYSFATEKNQVQKVHIGLNDFVPTFRGRTLTDMPELKLSDVQQMSILMADSQQGDFSLDLIELSLK